MTKMKDQQPNCLRVNDDIGNAFIAIADLLKIDRNELLEELMASYIESVRANLADITSTHPQYESKFPYVQHIQQH